MSTNAKYFVRIEHPVPDFVAWKKAEHNSINSISLFSSSESPLSGFRAGSNKGINYIIPRRQSLLVASHLRL